MPGEIPGFQTPQQQVAMPLNEPRLKSDGKSDGKGNGEAQLSKDVLVRVRQVMSRN
jgi:hypothetical protein